MQLGKEVNFNAKSLKVKTFLILLTILFMIRLIPRVWICINAPQNGGFSIPLIQAFKTRNMGIRNKISLNVHSEVQLPMELNFSVYVSQFSMLDGNVEEVWHEK